MALTKPKKTRYVKVRFTNTASKYGYTSSGEHFYRDQFKIPLKPFDVVICPTRYGMQLAIVKEVGVSRPEQFTVTQIKVVADKVKTSVFEDELREERQRELKKQLDKRIKEADKARLYDLYASYDPSIAVLVEELNALKGKES